MNFLESLVAEWYDLNLAATLFPKKRKPSGEPVL